MSQQGYYQQGPPPPQGYAQGRYVEQRLATSLRPSLRAETSVWEGPIAVLRPGTTSHGLEQSVYIGARRSRKHI
ncbi:hypothetical protein PG984_013652 [Apiospora sp. TS-2023a]